MKNRPILTGGYFRPTLYNGPLPRLHPQPEHISGMINYRRKARDRRNALYAVLLDWQDDLRRECQFERDLVKEVDKYGGSITRDFSDDPEAWGMLSLLFCATIFH